MRRLFAILMVALCSLLSAQPATADGFDHSDAIVVAEEKFIDRVEMEIYAIYLANVPLDIESQEQIGTVYSDDEMSGAVGSCAQIEPVIIDGRVYHIWARVFENGTIRANIYPDTATEEPVHQRGRQVFYTFALERFVEVPEQEAVSPGAAPSTQAAEISDAPGSTPKLSTAAVREHVSPYARDSFMNIRPLYSDDKEYYYTFDLHGYDESKAEYYFEVRIYNENDVQLEDWDYTLLFLREQVGPTDRPTRVPHISPQPTPSPEAIYDQPVIIEADEPTTAWWQGILYGLGMFLIVVVVIIIIARLVRRHRDREETRQAETEPTSESTEPRQDKR